MLQQSKVIKNRSFDIYNKQSLNSTFIRAKSNSCKSQSKMIKALNQAVKMSGDFKLSNDYG